MKLHHWVNLLVVGLAAALITFLSFRWAASTYADPTCRRYVESKGFAYTGYLPPDPGARTGGLHLSRDGNCQYRDADGRLQTYSLVTASGTNGAPFLVSLLLDWQLLFLGSFIGVALILALLIRALTGKPAS